MNGNLRSVYVRHGCMVLLRVRLPSFFCAGTRGYRVAGSRAELMFHELFTFKFIAIETPSDQEDQSRILRHLQDSITAWLAKRGKMSKADLDSRMRKKELWLNGLDAKELGFADIVIGNERNPC